MPRGRQAGLRSGTTVADLVARFNRQRLAAVRIAPGTECWYSWRRPAAVRARCTRVVRRCLSCHDDAFGARHERGSDPDVVAAMVTKAIEVSRPRACYLVGKDALLFALAAKLPPFVLDPIRRRIFGLVRPAASLSNPI